MPTISLRRPLGLVLVAMLFLTGCGAQNAMLGASGGLLLQGYDTLTHPGQAVAITARVQGGDFLKGMEGYLVGFYQFERKLGECRTDDNGLAQIDYAPPSPGNHVVLARLEDPDVRKYALPAVEIIVAAREKTDPMVVVDIDRTLVAGGFDEVLAGRAEPMADSVAVMTAISKKHPVIYLTHRPDVYTEMTKRWLRKYDYPLAPLVTSSITSFLKGSQAFKTAAIADLKASFPGIAYGIGDKTSDAFAYHANGLRAILIIHPELVRSPEDVHRWTRGLAGLPDGVDVVETWREVEQAFAGQRFPPSNVIERLKALATKLAEPESTPSAAPAAQERIEK